MPTSLSIAAAVAAAAGAGDTIVAAAVVVDGNRLLGGGDVDERVDGEADENNNQPPMPMSDSDTATRSVRLWRSPSLPEVQRRLRIRLLHRHWQAVDVVPVLEPVGDAAAAGAAVERRSQPYLV